MVEIMEVVRRLKSLKKEISDLDELVECSGFLDMGQAVADKYFPKIRGYLEEIDRQREDLAYWVPENYADWLARENEGQDK
jgi:hypothetical protein